MTECVMTSDGLESKISRTLESEVVEDYALAFVPDSKKKSGWKLAWPAMGISTTLAELLIGYLVSAIAGMELAIIADIIVAIYGGTLGWFVASVSQKSGVSSTVTSRFYGFGARGSIVTSGIFAFAQMGFLALENALLYYGTIFAFGWTNTLLHAVLIIGVLTVVWILLTMYGMNQILKVSSYLLILFLALLVYMFYVAGFQSGVSFYSIITHGALIPGLGSGTSRFLSIIGILAGSAGALALVNADYSRYAKTQRDVPKMTYWSQPSIYDY